LHQARQFEHPGEIQDMAVNLYRVINPVKNIDSAAEFFSAVLETDGERVSPGRHYFECGGTILACYDPVADGDDAGDGWHHHRNQYLYFAVPDLDATYKRVTGAGGVITAEIETMPWGERIFYAKDPGGNPISFVDQSTVFTGSAESP
jgi:predicted enzyme related to lactoylglutathione lyase